MTSWKSNAKHGLYLRGDLDELRNRDPISILVARECALKARLYYPDWELLYRILNSGNGIPYYGDASFVRGAEDDGKVRCNVIPDMCRGEMIRFYPNVDYFEKCVKPLLFRFGIEDLI